MISGAARLATEKAVFRPALPMSFLPGISEMQMQKMTYSEQLKHPNWQKKRLEMLTAADWCCTQCGTKEITLHVHHKQYAKGRMAWEYQSHELEVLCEECHEKAHVISDELKFLLLQVDNTEALALLAGFHFKSDWFDWKECDSGRDRMPEMFCVGAIASLLKALNPEKSIKVVELIGTLLSESQEESHFVPGVIKQLGELA